MQGQYHFTRSAEFYLALEQKEFPSKNDKRSRNILQINNKCKDKIMLDKPYIPYSRIPNSKIIHYING